MGSFLRDLYWIRTQYVSTYFPVSLAIIQLLSFLLIEIGIINYNLAKTQVYNQTLLCGLYSNDT
jgi:hypothetical protein